MTPSKGPRHRITRYFVLRARDGSTEVARIDPRGAPSIYEPETESWVNDPLLAAEIRMSDGWEKTEADQLPAGVDVTPPDEPTQQSPRRRRRLRRRSWRPGG